jgi:aspartate/methionine/tyrosine aminotransferase
MSFIANRLEYFDSSDFRNATKKQHELVDPIDLSIGVPEELTPEHIKAAGIKAIREDRTVYTPANGILELRQAISTKLADENNIHKDPQDVTIVPGLTTGQLLVYLAILNPGDEIIVLDPFYPPYAHLATMTGAFVIYAATTPTFQPNIEDIKANITNKTKAIVINSPNNPTGAVYPEETLREIAAIAKDHNMLIISDEIYEHFVYDSKHFSIGSIYPNTITMNGFSKEFAMTGWRLGYITGPSDIIAAINELQQYVVMSSSSIAQHAALAALQKLPDLSDKYRLKRNLVKEYLKDAGYEIHGLQGAYYAFFKAPDDQTDLEFVDQATEKGLILVPGRAFSSRLHGYVRLSYGAKIDTLIRGLAVLESMSQEKHPSHK